MKKAVFTTNPITGIEYYHGILDVTESYNRCCALAKEIARTGWTNSLNPMVKELTEEAGQHGQHRTEDIQDRGGDTLQTDADEQGENDDDDRHDLVFSLQERERAFSDEPGNLLHPVRSLV